MSKSGKSSINYALNMVFHSDHVSKTLIFNRDNRENEKLLHIISLVEHHIYMIQRPTYVILYPKIKMLYLTRVL